MNCYLPSDVARIVLGYLKENSYLKTYNCFMKECSLLHEYYTLVKAGRQPQLTHPHFNLVLILDEWALLKQKESASPRRDAFAAPSPVDSYSESPCKPAARSHPKLNSSITKSPTKASPRQRPSTKTDSLRETTPVKPTGATCAITRTSPCNKLDNSLSPKKKSRILQSPKKDTSNVVKSITNSPVKSTLQSHKDCQNNQAEELINQNTPEKHSIPQTSPGNNNIDKSPTNEREPNKIDNDKCTPSKKIQEDSCVTETPDNDKPSSAAEEEKTRKHSVLDEPTRSILEAGPLVRCLVTPKKTDPAPSPSRTIDSLVTPVKLFQHSDQASKGSPRRKKPKTPRKRLSDISITSNGITVNGKPVEDPLPAFLEILSNRNLHKKLAEHANKVSGQLKLVQSLREDVTKDISINISNTGAGQHSMEAETVIASRSLEDILETESNYTSDVLTDKLDMSDPVFESLFKLFNTDRSSFCESLRRERERSDAEMQAEIEDLERSIHAIESANQAELASSQGDEGYQTQGVTHDSPHYLSSQQDLFASQPAHSVSPSSGHATSTPCGSAIGLTPLLSGNELGSGSPHSHTSNTGYQTENPYSHSHPATPQAYDNTGSAGPSTPSQLSSPGAGQHLHSTPHGPAAVRTHTNHPACSPLVKADLHPGSPLMCQKPSNPQARKNILHGHDTQLTFFNPQEPTTSAVSVSNVITNNDHINNPELLSAVTPVLHGDMDDDIADSYLGLLTEAIDEANHQSLFGGSEPCSTIENTIGCISLPKPAQPELIQARRHGQGRGKTGRRKQNKKSKRKNQFSTLKGLLEKHPNQENSPAFLPLTLTPTKTGIEQTILLSSPGGTKLDVPILSCQDAGQVLSQGETSAALAVNPMSSAEGIFPSWNGSSASLIPNTCASVGGQPVPLNTTQPLTVLPGLNVMCITDETHNSNKKKKGKKNKETADSKKNVKKASSCAEKFKSPEITGGKPTDSETGEIFTATPILQNNIISRTHVRSLDFEVRSDDPKIAHFRKICPKPRQCQQQAPPLTPQIIILHTSSIQSALSDNQHDQKQDQLSTVVSIKENGAVAIPTEDGSNSVECLSNTSSPRKPSPRKLRQRTKSSLKNEEPKSPTKKAMCKSSQVLGIDSSSENESSDKGTMDNSGINVIIDGESDSETVRVLGVKNGKLVGNTSKTNVKSHSKVQKSILSKKSKSRRSGDKLKVRIAGNNSHKDEDCDIIKRKTLPFRRKPPTKTQDDSSLSDDLPLSELKNKLKNTDKHTPKDSAIEPTKSPDLEKENQKVTLESTTPKKRSVEADEKLITPSKEEMLESVGLTPTKSLSLSAKHNQSARRRLRSGDTYLTAAINTCEQAKPSKILFTSPTEVKRKDKKDKSKVKHKNVTKRVNSMIKNLRKHNPDQALMQVETKMPESPLEMGIEDPDSLTSLPEVKIENTTPSRNLRKGSRGLFESPEADIKVEAEEQNLNRLCEVEDDSVVIDQAKYENNTSDNNANHLSKTMCNTKQKANVSSNNVSSPTQKSLFSNETYEKVFKTEKDVNKDDNSDEHNGENDDYGDDYNSEERETEAAVSALVGIQDAESELCTQNFNDCNDTNYISGNIGADDACNKFEHVVDEDIDHSNGESDGDNVTVVEKLCLDTVEEQITNEPVDSDSKAKSECNSSVIQHESSNRDYKLDESKEQTNNDSVSTSASRHHKKKKKKHKHKHRHREGEGREGEAGQTGHSEGEDRSRRHKHKKKHKKRRREELEGETEEIQVKRAKLDQRLSDEHLKQINIDEALSKIYN